MKSLVVYESRFGNTPSIRQWLRDGKPIADHPIAQRFFSQQ